MVATLAPVAAGEGETAAPFDARSITPEDKGSPDGEAKAGGSLSDKGSIEHQYSGRALARDLDPSVLRGLAKEPCFDLSLSWTAREQQQILLKTDFLILVPALFTFVVLCIDRSNVAFALIDNLMADVGMDGNDVNTASNLFNVGIIIFELPSQWFAKRCSPNRYLPFTILCWGACTIGQGFVRTKGQFFAVRFLIGMFEAGFSPGMSYYLGRYYQNREIASRYAVFWSANGVSFAISGLLSLGILNLRGVGGRPGWSWLFAIEGAFTILVAIFALLWFPDGPHKQKPMIPLWNRLFGFTLFSDREAAIIRTRVLLEDPLKSDETARSPLTLGDVIATFADWRLFFVVLCVFASSMMQSVVGTYLPYMVQQMGFSGYSAGGLTVPGCVTSIAFGIAVGYGVNRYGMHSLWICLVNGCGIGAMIWLAAPPDDANRYFLYAGVILLLTFTGSQAGAMASWLAGSVQSRRRPVALAMYVMTSNLAGIAGNQTLRANGAWRGVVRQGCCLLTLPTLHRRAALPQGLGHPVRDHLRGCTSRPCRTLPPSQSAGRAPLAGQQRVRHARQSRAGHHRMSLPALALLYLQLDSSPCYSVPREERVKVARATARAQ